MDVYGYEQPQVFTPQSLFNPTTAQMVLSLMNNYAAALKDDYDNTRKDYKDFVEKYENFYSPSDVDTQNAFNSTLGVVRDELQAMLEAGIDPMRSIEGRSRIRFLIDRINPKIAKEAQLSSATMQKYYTNMAKLMSKGKYSPEMELAALELEYGPGVDPKTWNTSQRGVWTRESPIVAKNIFDFVKPNFDKFDKDRYISVDPNNPDFYLVGMNKEDIESGEVATLNDILHSEQLPYFMKMAERAYREENGDDGEIHIGEDGHQYVTEISESEKQKQLLKMIRAAAAQYTQPKSIEKSDSSGNLKKASASRSSGSHVTIVNNGQQSNYSDNPNYRPDFNVSSLRQIAIDNPADENIGYPIDVAFNKAKTKAAKIKENDKKSEAILTDPAICFSYYDIPTISEVIANDRSMTFSITPGMVHNMVTADEVVPQSRNNNGKKHRSIIEKSFGKYYAEGGFYKQTASPTGRISYVPTKNGEIRPYYEIIVTVPDYEKVVEVPDATKPTITQPRAESTKTFTMWYPSGEYYGKEQTEDGGFIRLDKGQRSGQEQKYTGAAYGYSSPTPKVNTGVGYNAQSEVELMRLEEKQQQKNNKR